MSASRSQADIGAALAHVSDGPVSDVLRLFDQSSAPGCIRR